MKKFILKHSTGKKVVVLFIFANLIYLIMVTFTIPKTAAFANDMKLLDMMPGGYNFDYVKTLFTELGDEGRHAYLFTQIPLDLIYPALFAFGYSLLLAFFLKKLQKQNSPLIYLCWLPFIGGTADYLENIGIIYLLSQYPEITENTVKLTSLFSLIKSSATSVYFITLLIVLIVLGVKWIRRKI